jgi:hypothetical protein
MKQVQEAIVSEEDNVSKNSLSTAQKPLKMEWTTKGVDHETVSSVTICYFLV